MREREISSQIKYRLSRLHSARAIMTIHKRIPDPILWILVDCAGTLLNILPC